MSARPQLSICIPSYNLGEWTADAVVSALAVGQPDEVEVVVVDDGSSPDTLEVLANLDPAPNLRIICPDDHLGMVGNFNRSVRNTLGSWVTVLGGDDELFPGYYENLRPHLDSRDVAAISQIAWMQWGNNHESAFGPTVTRTFDADQIAEMLGGAMCISTTAFRRDLFDQVGGFAADVGTLFDLDLFFRICRGSQLPIRALAESGGRYYPLRGSTWTNQQGSGEGSELLLGWLRLREAELGPDSARRVTTALAGRARAAGRHCLATGNSRAAIRNFAVAVECSNGLERMKNRAGKLAGLFPGSVARSAHAAYDSIRSSVSSSDG